MYLYTYAACVQLGITRLEMTSRSRARHILCMTYRVKTLTRLKLVILAQDLLKTCPRLSQDLPKTCSRFILGVENLKNSLKS